MKWRWDQLLIFTCGVAGIALSQIPVPSLNRFACIAGLLGQVGWFSAVKLREQPGMFFTCVAYALVWVYGFAVHWL